MFANLRLFWDSSEVWWGLRAKLGCGQGPGPITVGGPLDALFQSTSGLEWEYHLSANVQVPCLISKTTSGKSLNLFFFLFSFSTSEMWERCYLLYRIVLRLEWYNLCEDTWKMRKHSISAKHVRLKLTSWSAWRRKIGLKMSPKGQEWQVESCDKQRGNIGCRLRTQIWAWIVIIYCMCNMGVLFNLS